MTTPPAAGPPAAGLPTPSPRRFEIVTVASSAGGVTALQVLLAGLPGRFPVPVVVVQHLDPRHETELDEVLERQGELPVKVAENGEQARPGTVYIAPADQDLAVGPDGTFAPRRHDQFVHPAANPVLEAAAQAYGPAVIACVLTGFGEDGAKGVQAVKASGGTVIVEEPASAKVRGMPDAAVAAVDADHVLPVADIAPVLCRLVQGEVS
jgi:two-component system, chemotaxis family, protein-glutamate methylesterase/glutaminase